MARTFIPTCITRGHVEVFTAKGTEVFAFSHLSAASSTDTAQRNAFAAATNAVRFLPGATGYQFMYYPKANFYSAGPTEDLDAETGVYSWSITAEEV